MLADTALKVEVFLATGEPTSVPEAPLARPRSVLAISFICVVVQLVCISCQVVVDIEGILDVPLLVSCGCHQLLLIDSFATCRSRIGWDLISVSAAVRGPT